MAIRCPDDFLTQAVETFNQLNGNAGGHNPVGTRFDRRRGISVDHYGAIGINIAKYTKLFLRAAQIQRAFGLQCRHQHLFFRTEYLGGFPHKTYPSDQQRRSRMRTKRAISNESATQRLFSSASA